MTCIPIEFPPQLPIEIPAQTERDVATGLVVVAATNSERANA
jgi:hypothetical protein